MTTKPNVRTKSVKTAETFFDAAWATAGITVAFAVTRSAHGLAPVEEALVASFCASTLVGAVRFLKSAWREWLVRREEHYG